MHPLVIGSEEIKALTELREYAEKHPFTMDEMLDRKNGTMPVPGDNPLFVRKIPIGFRVVFTIEPAIYKDKNKEPGKCRHLSISVTTEDRLPNMPACQIIMDHLGFINKIDSDKIVKQIEADAAVSIAEIIE